MFANKKILAIIPARGGSKGIPNKNIREMLGKPLLFWTISEAKKSKYLDRIILSSESEEIIEIAKSLGCEAPFQRPVELATDEVSGVEPVLHAINLCPGYDYVVLLQPTSPLRRAEDIDSCIEKCITKNVSSCISVVRAKPASWFVQLEESGEVIQASEGSDKSRQLAKPNYLYNGAIYTICTNKLRQDKKFVFEDSIGYEMSIEDSIDIDTHFDWLIAETFLKRRLEEQ